MGRNSKWIEAGPNDSTERVARLALAARLERIWHYLQLSVSDPSRETENVHQLRVFARRATAALEIFDTWLPPRRGRWMRKQVKRVRQAAGEARDLDVLRIRWRDLGERLPSGQSRLLLKEVKRCRREAQGPIEAITATLVRKRFLRRKSRFLKRIAARGGGEPRPQPFECLARQALGQLVVGYLAAATAELSEAEALHAFRIQGKQVRYAMEIFAGAFDAEFRDTLYPLVAMLQDRLGAINDHVTAQTYFAHWRDATDSCALRQALEMGLGHEQSCFESARQEFLAWWTFDRREDLRRRFGHYVQIDSAADPPTCRDDCGR